MGRTRDLTEEQVRAIRPLAERALRLAGTQEKLAEQIGCSQSTISAFVSSKRQGTSLMVAFRICGMVGADPFAVLSMPRPPGVTFGTDTPDLPVGEFVRDLELKPGLKKTIFEDPQRWRLSTVIRAIATPHQSDSDGVPLGGWRKVLDAIQSGAADETSGDAVSVAEATSAQVGPRPRIRP